MPLVRRIRRRNAYMVVEAHAEVLFTATGDVGRWTNRLSNRITAFTAAAAPNNKRPRWAHYGRALKTTFTSSTTYQPGRMRVYAAVGSKAPHAVFVDQGTGVFNGGTPWKAAILPPRTEGGSDLYEATWRPGGPGNPRVKPIMIQGQKGQKFFEKGLRRGFQSMRMRTYQVPGEGGPRISSVLNSAPPSMLGKVLGPSATPAFMAQLEQWREDRDKAYIRNRDRDKTERKNRPRKPSKPKPSKPPKPRPNKTAKAIEAAKRVMAAYVMRHPGARITGYNAQGFTVAGQPGRIFWPIRVADLFVEAGEFK
jgi:hypothetical protein